MKYWERPGRRDLRSKPMPRMDSRRPIGHALVMAASKDWDRLGAHVLSWRDRLDMSREELGRRMGKAAKTIQRIENGKPVYGTTLAALENALRWEPGSALTVLRGGKPTPIESVQPPTDPEERAIYDSMGPLLSHDERMQTIRHVMEQRRHSATGM